MKGAGAVFIFRFLPVAKILLRLSIPPEMDRKIAGPPKAHH